MASERHRGHGGGRNARVNQCNMAGGGACCQQVVLGHVLEGEQRMRGGAGVDKRPSDQIPGPQRVIPGCRVSHSGVPRIEDSSGNWPGVSREEGKRSTLRCAHGGVQLPPLGNAGGARWKQVLRSRRSIGLLCGPEANIVVQATSQKAVGRCMHGQGLDSGLMSVQLQLRGDLPRKPVFVLRVLPQADSAVETGGSNLVGRHELGGLDGGSVTSLRGSGRGGDCLRGHVPYPKQTIIASRQDPFLAFGESGARGPRRSGRGGGQHVGRADPVVMLERCDMEWWNQSTNVLNLEGGFSRNAIGSQVFIDRGP